MAKTPKKKKTVKRKKKVTATSKKKTATSKKSRRPLEEIVAEQLGPAQDELAKLMPATPGPGSLASLAVPGDDEPEIDDFTDVTQEKSSIISIVRGFEEQVETAFALKEVLEDELNTTQERLAQEVEARSELETQVELLQTRAALAEQLREDITFIEQERNKFADELAQLRPQFEEAVAERDALSERLGSSESNAKGLEGDKLTLEAQVMNLKDKIIDADALQRELTETARDYQNLREQHHDLNKRLDASQAGQEALQDELTGTHENAQAWRGESEELRKKLAGAQGQISDLNIQLRDQQDTNRELMSTNTRLENELATTSTDGEAAKKELYSLKLALRDIRSEAKKTSGRVRQKYARPGASSS